MNETENILHPNFEISSQTWSKIDTYRKLLNSPKLLNYSVGICYDFLVLSLFGECTWYKHDSLRVAKRRCLCEPPGPSTPKLHEEIAVHDLPRLWSNSIRTACLLVVLRYLLFTVTSTKCRLILQYTCCWILVSIFLFALIQATDEMVVVLLLDKIVNQKTSSCDDNINSKQFEVWLSRLLIR